jgi:UDPglucose 6-dehydrogenase
MKIAIIGSGHVGLVTGACFADLGNQVLCMDQDTKKINLLKQGKMPFFDPGLSELVLKNVRQKRLRFSTSVREAVRHAKVVFLCVGTPPRESGEADLSSIEDVAEEIAASMTEYRLVVEKSTVPVETGLQLYKTIKENRRKGVSFDVASNPEFLREGAAVHDFFRPDRIVLGVQSKRAEKLLMDIYRPFKVPMIVTDIQSAEMIKHASNSFLATKISFANLVGQMCEKVGADISKVTEGMGSDLRIGKAFLSAGIGYGGFCFPKDLQAFTRIGQKLKVNCNLFESVAAINETQKRDFIHKVQDALWNFNGKTMAILGLSFKPDTDDMRYAPSVDIINRLQAEGAKIRAFDPQAIPAAKRIFKGIQYAKNAYEACRRADALLILTEWREFKKLDLRRIKKLLKRPIIIDGRNIYDPTVVKKLGYQYHSVGRAPVNVSSARMS